MGHPRKTKYKYVTNKQPLADNTIESGLFLCGFFVILLAAAAVFFLALLLVSISTIGWKGLIVFSPLGIASFFYCSILAVCFFKGRKDYITLSTQGITLYFQPKPQCWKKAESEFIAWERIAEYRYETVYGGKGPNLYYLVIELIGETKPRRYNVNHFPPSETWMMKMFDLYAQL